MRREVAAMRENNEEKEVRRRREGKEEAAAMKREKDNKFIIINEDANSHVGMLGTQNHRIDSYNSSSKTASNTPSSSE